MVSFKSPLDELLYLTELHSVLHLLTLCNITGRSRNITGRSRNITGRSTSGQISFKNVYMLTHM